MRFLLFMAVLMVSVAPLPAGPVPSTGKLPTKIEELENAAHLLAQGKADEAFKLIQEAKRKYPALAPARLILGRMAMRVNPQQARAVIEQAATEEPEHPAVFLTMADLALGDGRINDAILNASKALELSNQPRWTADQKTGFLTQGRALLSTAYEMRRDYANALANLTAWHELEPNNGQVRRRLGSAQFQMGKVDEALKNFQEAVKDDPSLLPASVLMARSYMEKMDFKKAGEFFERAVQQDGNNPRVHVAYAEYLLQQGNLAGAKAQAELAAREDPKNLDVQRMQATVARFSRDYPAAIKLFQAILDNTPGDYFASNQLALILADTSDDAQRKKALQYAQVNARQYENNAAYVIDVLSTLGYSLFRTGNVDEARQVMSKCAQLAVGRPVSPDTVYFIALTLANQRVNAEETRRLLKQALDSPGLFFFRAEAQAMYDKLDKEVPTDKKAAPNEKVKGG